MLLGSTVAGMFSYIGAKSSPGNFLYLGLEDFGGVGGRAGLDSWLEGLILAFEPC